MGTNKFISISNTNEEFFGICKFEGGKIVHYDMMSMLETEVFFPLKNRDVVMDACTVLNDIFAWDLSKDWNNTTCPDIDSETLYALSFAEEQIAQ